MTVIYKALKNQSLTDIALQEIGSSLAVVDLAKANNLSPTAVLVPGQSLVIPPSKYTDAKIVAAYKKDGITVASQGTAATSQTISNEYLIPGVFPVL